MKDRNQISFNFPIMFLLDLTFAPALQSTSSNFRGCFSHRTPKPVNIINGQTSYLESSKSGIGEHCHKILLYPCEAPLIIAFSSVCNHETTEQPNASTENGAHKSKGHKAQLKIRKSKQGSQYMYNVTSLRIRLKSVALKTTNTFPVCFMYIPSYQQCNKY